MSTKKVFSPEEIAMLRANPYTERVTTEQISFTLAFKEEFWRLSIEGCTGNTAFRKLGYDPEVLGFERVHNITKRIRRAAKTPEGLKGKAKSRMRVSKEHSIPQGAVDLLIQEHDKHPDNPYMFPLAGYRCDVPPGLRSKAPRENSEGCRAGTYPLPRPQTHVRNPGPPKRRRRENRQ